MVDTEIGGVRKVKGGTGCVDAVPAVDAYAITEVAPRECHSAWPLVISLNFNTESQLINPSIVDDALAPASVLPNQGSTEHRLNNRPSHKFGL